MPNLVWLHGLFPSAVVRGYGGGERSFYLSNLISRLTGLSAVEVFYKSPLSYREAIPEGVVGIPFSWPVAVERSLLKALKPALGPHSSWKIRLLRPSRRGIEGLFELAGDGDLLALDGLKGFTMARPILGRIRRRIGAIIYLSHDFEADYLRGSKGWVLRAEKEAVEASDLLISASARDAVRYRMTIGARPEKITVFPNIYPVEFEPREKAEGLAAAVLAGSSPKLARGVAITLLRHGPVSSLIYVGKDAPVDVKTPSARASAWGKEVIYERFVEDRAELLSMISVAHIGINHGEWLGGSSVKRYDYALAGLAVLSLGTGHRGDHLPGDVACADFYDLLGKLSQLDVNTLVELGKENREMALRRHEEAVKHLERKLREVGF